MKKLRDLSLQQKLFGTIMLTAMAVLLLSAVASGVYQVLTFRTMMIVQIESLADILGANNRAALRFRVAHSAEESLEALQTIPRIEAACFFDSDDRLLASFARSDEAPALPARPEAPGYTFHFDHFTLVRQVIHDGDLIGTLHIVSNLHELYANLFHSFYAMALVIAACCLLALLLSRRFLAVLATPIQNLVDTAAEISRTQDFSLRAEKFSNDDMGLVADSFNHMVQQIQSRDAELIRTHAELEARVNELHEEQAKLDTTRKTEIELRERLSRSERMESLGQLAGGVAHDLNNILGPVVAYPDMILEQLPEDDPNRDDLMRIRDSADRAIGVIQDLLTLGRRGNYNVESVDLNALITRYLRSPDYTRLRDRNREVIVETTLEPDLPLISGSAHHLSEVLMNFVINAYEAMQEGGRLTIATSRQCLAEPILAFDDIEAGDYCVLSVRDTGVGIEDADLQHIFEPFYTQKQMGRSGSGLGLAVVYGVVKDLDGRIDVRSEPGKGSTFQVYFPPASSEPVIQLPTTSDAHGSEKILVVDDVNEQRELAVRLLRSLGYSVKAVEDGQSAVDYISTHKVDLMVLDMIMGDGLDGLSTFRRYIDKWPDGRCLLVSGFSESARVKEALACGAGAFVAKPYNRQTLASAVREVLDKA